MSTPSSQAHGDATIVARAAGHVDPASGGVVPAIQPSTTFVRGSDYAPLRAGHVYLRDDNDAARLAERIIAQLEEAEAALLFPSGMAAIAAVLRQVEHGEQIIIQRGIYWGTTYWARGFCERQGIHLEEVAAGDLGPSVERLKPRLVLIETPSNPGLEIVDIARMAETCKRSNTVLLVDSTAATPILTKPLTLGADIVMHSATKGLNGHSDVLAGALATRQPEGAIWRGIAAERHDAGAVIGPFEAWLLVRGMRTLSLRVERMSANALRIAEHLAAHPGVTRVLYPGLAGHPGHAIARAQMRCGYGCLLSILVRGGRKAALRFCGRLQLIHRATSLGGVESLAEHRHTIEGDITGVPPELVRLSIGIEDVDDLIADLDQALA